MVSSIFPLDGAGLAGMTGTHHAFVFVFVLPGLPLNFNPPDLCLLSNSDYRQVTVPRFFFFFFFKMWCWISILGALGMLDKCCATELQPQLPTPCDF
jgi:hypothetical protein